MAVEAEDYLLSYSFLLVFSLLLALAQPAFERREFELQELVHPNCAKPVKHCLLFVLYVPSLLP